MPEIPIKPCTKTQDGRHEPNQLGVCKYCDKLATHDCWTWILDEDNKPVPEPDIGKWGEWMEPTLRHFVTGGPPASYKRRVGYDQFEDGSQLSTVFLAIDHSLGMSPQRKLFETMYTDKNGELTPMMTYVTWLDALEGHEHYKKLVASAVENGHEFVCTGHEEDDDA